MLKNIYRKLKAIYLRNLINKKYKVSLLKFKDLHKGKRCFIIGNGPSLKVADLECLSNEFTFAANKIFLIFSETNWRPTYYCIQDFVMINNELAQLDQIEADSKFIAGNELIKKGIQLNSFNYFFLNTEKFYPNLPKFSISPDHQIYEGYTVTYAEIQLAVFMGFTEIFLLGVDFNYSSIITNSGDIIDNGGASYFSEKYMDQMKFGKDLNYPNLDNSYLAYLAAEKYTKSNGIRIYNATRGGKLDVFERIDFDLLFP